jgi:hypothetical protein
MDQIDEFVLCDERTEWFWAIVTASVENDHLKIAGQDLGEMPMEFYGANEYEYWYDFDENNTQRLVSLLTESGPDVKKQLIEKFGGLDGCRKLRGFCCENEIKYDFRYWVPRKRKSPPSPDPLYGRKTYYCP